MHPPIGNSESIMSAYGMLLTMRPWRRGKRGGVLLLLVLDSGNSCLVMGVYQGEDLLTTAHVGTSLARDEREYLDLVRKFIREKAVPKDKITTIGISNVVPRLNSLLDEAVRELFGIAPFFVGHSHTDLITLDIETPSELGADLVAAAVAAYRKHRDSLIIIDMGSATTFSHITGEGSFQGVIICPGLRMGAEFFSARIPYLPEVKLAVPQKLLGRNSVESIQSGLMLGHIAMLEGIVRRLQEHYGRPGKVIACGGFAHVLRSHLPFVDSVEPFLVLEGIRVLSESGEAR
ncbi:MAG: type III pantothenate kinase [Candidatus Eremiobacteraeota bacterium]|nr:type III pantothenate kinase [Candidatus Eremiobacteraeota bacterium]